MQPPFSASLCRATWSFLYLLMPLHAAAFSVTLPEGGILLAANRLVR